MHMVVMACRFSSLPSPRRRPQLSLRRPSTPATPHGRLLALPDEAVAYVPASAGPRPPLLVLLHGAGRTRMWMIDHFEAQADKRGIVLLAPTSFGPTWDVISVAMEPPSPGSVLAERLGHRYGGSRNSKRVEAAIGNLARTVSVDLARTVLAGFSDGATFALAMGMARSHTYLRGYRLVARDPDRNLPARARPPRLRKPRPPGPNTQLRRRLQ